MESGIPGLLYKLALLVVIAGHFFFAYSQWFKWPKLCEKLTNLNSDEIESTRFLGRSIASYNFSIGIGLLLSLFISKSAAVQGVVLALIAVTAIVGSMGTKGRSILLMRFLPAVISLALLLAVSFSN